MISTIAAALEAREYKTLTQVQIEVSKEEFVGKDLLVSAQTGSGKTVGFGLAIAPVLLGEEERFEPASAPLALVIAPTRELAIQVKRELSWLYSGAGAVMASCVGGMDMRDERRTLARGAHIVVATPGRLRDHIMRGSLDMSNIRSVVLDEADEMLDLGFSEDLQFILGEAPEDRQTLMFSATVPRGIASLAKQYQKSDAIRVQTVSEQKQHSDIEYRALTVAGNDPENAIINLLRFYEAKNALVFCNTRAVVNRLTSRFSNRGFQVVALSGELSQTERTHALQAMRDGRARVCVATDVAARGIDLPGLELVIHADLPSNSETLLHRSGRTGRAGRKGVSALVVPQRWRSKAERLLKGAKVQAEWAAPPSADEVLARDEERLLGDDAWTQEITPEELGFVGKLTGLHSAEQIAAAYLRLYRARQSAPEELAKVGDAPAKRAPREAFGPSTWFSISAGRNDKAEPRWLLPLVCRAGDITKDDIGAIRIQQEESFVEVSQKALPGFLAKLNGKMELEKGAVLTQLDKPPVLAPYGGGKGGDTRKPRDAGRKPARKSAHKPAPERAAAPAPRAEHVSDAWEERVPQPSHQDRVRKERHKTDRTPRPNGASGAGDGTVQGYKGKPKSSGKPGAKPRFDKPGGKPSGGKPAYAKGGKPGGKPKGEYESKPRSDKPKGDYASKPRADKPKAAPGDTSKRFTPPGGKPTKLRRAKGGTATPRRRD